MLVPNQFESVKITCARITKSCLKSDKNSLNLTQRLSTLLKTGSILLACAQFGAQVIGSDIDFLMVHARTKPSRVGQKKRIKGESFKGNFEQYTLTAKLLDVIVAGR